jgi:hypothetical protein
VRAKKEDEKPPVLFVSSGVADAPFAKALSRGLREKGLEVRMADDLVSMGESWESAMNSFLHQVNAAVFVVSEKPSNWTNHEIKAVQMRKIPITPVIVGAKAKIPELLRETHGITLKVGDVITHADKVSDKVVSQIVEHLFKHRVR